MKIAALLPHLEVFGGVRRYLEIGNELQRRRYRFVLFHPDGGRPDWFDFKGETKPIPVLGEEKRNSFIFSWRGIKRRRRSSRETISSSGIQKEYAAVLRKGIMFLA